MQENIKKYINKNNIKSYLTYNDLEALKEYVDIKRFEYAKSWHEGVETIEDYILQEIEIYNYSLALENEDIGVLSSYIYGCDFDIEINKSGLLDLIDMQGAYLGGVESYENFENILDTLDRLSDSFLYDYYGI